MSQRILLRSVIKRVRPVLKADLKPLALARVAGSSRGADKKPVAEMLQADRHRAMFFTLPGEWPAPSVSVSGCQVLFCSARNFLFFTKKGKIILDAPSFFLFP